MVSSLPLNLTALLTVSASAPNRCESFLVESALISSYTDGACGRVPSLESKWANKFRSSRGALFWLDTPADKGGGETDVGVVEIRKEGSAWDIECARDRAVALEVGVKGGISRRRGWCRWRVDISATPLSISSSTGTSGGTSGSTDLMLSTGLRFPRPLQLCSLSHHVIDLILLSFSSPYS